MARKERGQGPSRLRGSPQTPARRCASSPQHQMATECGEFTRRERALVPFLFYRSIFLTICLILFMYPNNLCADVRPGEQGYLPDPVADIFMVHDVRTILLSPPVDGRVSSFYGWRMDPLSGLKRFHSGLDFAGVPGDEVFAAAGGKVVHTGPTSGCGLAVTIEHKGEIITRYCHLSHIGVATGEEVQGGGIIGAVGSTGRSHGPHLHFELWEGDHPTDPSPKIALLD